MDHYFIAEAEAKYKSELTVICKRLFRETHMPSHDHLHHARVWKNASSLLKRLYDAGVITGPGIAEKTIIASFFHDTGLTMNRGTDHGKQSRLLCSGYLRDTALSETERKDILDAVEKHDDKEYSSASDPASLAAIISVADDMDAFGKKGIERYDEIYSLRGISVAERPQKIISNARARFNHLAKTYSMFPDIVRKEKKRLDILVTHYENQKS